MTHTNMSYALQWFCLGCSSAQVGSLPCPLWDMFNSVRSSRNVYRHPTVWCNITDNGETFFEQLKTPLSTSGIEYIYYIVWLLQKNNREVHRHSTHISSELLEDSAELFLLFALMLLCKLNWPAWWRLQDRVSALESRDGGTVMVR